MTDILRKVALGGLVLALMAPAAVWAADIDGSYKLVKRVLPDGTEIGWGPDLMGFNTMVDGWRSFHVTWSHGDHRDSTSLIARYTLSDTEFCEDVQYWDRHNMGVQGQTYEPAAATKECAAVTMVGGYPQFALPGEPVVVTFSEKGMVARNEGVFVDYWEKVD